MSRPIPPSSRQKSPAISPRCWSATTSRSRPGNCWRGSTTAISGPRSTRPMPMSRASEAAVRNLDAQIALQQPLIEQEHRRRRRRRSQSAIRAGRTNPLRRPDEVRLRHGAARPADRRGAARKDRAIAARQIRADRRAEARSTCSPPSGPRRWRNSITPARSKQQAALNLSYTEIIGAGRRHRRRPHAAGRPIRAGRHAVDGGGAARCGLCGRELQGDPAHPCAQRPAGRSARSTAFTAPS